MISIRNKIRSLRNKIRFSIANRLSLTFFSVFILSVGIIYLYVVPQLSSRLADQKKDNLMNYATRFSQGFVIAYNQGANSIQLALLTQQSAELADARILLMSPTGELMTDSLKGQSFNADDYPVANTAMSNLSPVSDVVQVENRKYAMAAVPLESGGKIFGVIVVSSSMSDVDSAVSLVQRQLSTAALVALIIALAAIYLTSRILARRVQGIERGARRIAQGDFATRVPIKTQDELGQLAVAFNDMGDRLGAAFQQVDMEKRRAKLLLDDLSEGVVGIDTVGNIIVANPAAERVLGREISAPCRLSDCLPGEVFDLWKSMNKKNPVREDTFIVGGEQALQVHSSFLSDQAELKSLLVLRDVSQEVKLERSRRDFIANASHELKTPLFSLGGFLEILQDEEVEEETKREFVATMKEQVDRLSELARNLLDLSRMDAGAMSIDNDGVELRELIESVAREFTAQSLGHDSLVDTSGLPAGLVAVCDRGRTAQLVSILLDNALKYSPEGSTVEVSGNGNGDTVCFTIADAGPGIPKEEITRVFERFFRGKGAGRIRGTGLGLSIAQELVRLMKGTIEVESSPSGTRFNVTLPAGCSVLVNE